MAKTFLITPKMVTGGHEVSIHFHDLKGSEITCTKPILHPKSPGFDLISNTNEFHVWVFHTWMQGSMFIDHCFDKNWKMGLRLASLIHSLVVASLQSNLLDSVANARQRKRAAALRWFFKCRVRTRATARPNLGMDAEPVFETPNGQSRPKSLSGFMNKIAVVSFQKHFWRNGGFDLA